MAFDTLDAVEHLNAQPFNDQLDASIGQSISGTGFYEDTLRQLAASAGLGNYTFEDLRADLNDLRAKLFAKARHKNSAGVPQDFFKEWAMVSDPVVMAFPAGFIHSMASPGRGMRRKDMDLIYSGNANTSLRTVLNLRRTDEIFPNAALADFGEIKITIDDAPAVRSISSPNQASTATAIDFEVHYTPATPVATNLQLHGRTDWFSVSPSGLGVGPPLRVKVVFSGNPNVVNDVESFILNCSLPGKTITRCIRTIQNFSIFSTQTHATAHLQPGGNYARVISPTTSDWRRLRSARCTVKKNGASILEECDYFVADLPISSEVRYWRFRTTPIGKVSYESIASPAERWRASRKFTHGNDVFTRISDTSRVTDAPIARVRPPHGATIQNLWTDATRAAAHWPDWQTVEITVPDGVSGDPENPPSWNLPAVDVGFPIEDPYENTFRARYFRIPIAIDPESEVFSAWNNAQGDATLAKTFGETMLADFHDARLTDESGNTFWYRDVIALLNNDVGDPVPKLRRFSYWRVAREESGFALYLYTAPTSRTPTSVEVIMGVPTPVYEEVPFTPPAGAVSAEDYRAQTFHGTWPDYNAPWRFFNLRVSGPIAEWTIGKNAAVGFTPGQRLKLHLPRRIARQSAFQFAMQKQDGWNATIDFQATRLPALAPRSGNSFTGRFTEIYDVETWRSPRKLLWSVFRNGRARIGYRHVRDLRLFLVAQSDIARDAVTNNGQFLDYAYEALPGFRDLGVGIKTILHDANVQELNAGDFTHDNATGEIVFNRIDALPDGDEFQNLMLTFEAGSGNIATEENLEAQNPLPQIEVVYGNVVDGAVPLAFTPYRRQVIGAGARHARQTSGSFYQNPDLDGPQLNEFYVSPRWIYDRIWPLTYQLDRKPVAFEFEASAYTYRVPAHPAGSRDVSGKLVKIWAAEDFTLRYRVGWRSVHYSPYAANIIPLQTTPADGWVIAGAELHGGVTVWGAQRQFVVRWYKLDGEQLTPASLGGQYILTDALGNQPAQGEMLRFENEHYAITETDFLGRSFTDEQYVPPRTARTDSISPYQRLIYFLPISARQNFAVRSVVTELWNQPVSQAEIVGLPFTFHLNETRRLLQAWIDAGKPA